MIAYIALFSALLSRLTALACDSTRVTTLFIAHFFNIHRSGVLTALAWLVPHETAAVSAQVLCTPYNHAPTCHIMQSHIRQVYACLAVTCQLHCLIILTKSVERQQLIRCIRLANQVLFRNVYGDWLYEKNCIVIGC